MNLRFFRARLSKNAHTIRSLVTDISEEQARWKPSPDEWSILEVINHLYDEEREDFRQRLNLLLHQPEQPWPGINPTGWVIERRYNSRDPQASLRSFLQERQRSVAWLEGLVAPDWHARREHPQAGALTAGDLLASWLAHDFLHLRQLTQLRWQYLAVAAPGRRVDYAGNW
ncbi:MAG: DinB family protein [Chloroflexota bacterium]